MKAVLAALSIAGLVVAVSVPALAGQPVNPGAFGKARAVGVQNFQCDCTPDTAAPGSSDFGHIAADRAEDNGDQNRGSQTALGGDPDPSADNGIGND